jgi:hypothetical protein
MWLTIWFMVILKIPIAYLAYVIWLSLYTHLTLPTTPYV